MAGRPPAWRYPVKQFLGSRQGKLGGGALRGNIHWLDLFHDGVWVRRGTTKNGFVRWVAEDLGQHRAVVKMALFTRAARGN